MADILPFVLVESQLLAKSLHVRIFITRVSLRLDARRDRNPRLPVCTDLQLDNVSAFEGM